VKAHAAPKIAGLDDVPDGEPVEGVGERGDFGRKRPVRSGRAAGDERLAAVDAMPLRRWEFEGLHVLAALVATGAGVAFLPSGVVQDQPGIVGLPIVPRMHRDILALTRAADREDPAIAACLRAARHSLADDR
jgi:DNA-binding transcriptional LysR family regulator